MKLWLILSTILIVVIVTPTEQASYEQKQAYFKKLLNLHKLIKQNTQSLQYLNQHTIDNTASLKSYPDLQRVILNQGVLNQRDQIESTLTLTQIPLKQNTWTCKDLSNAQKNMIAEKIQDLKKKGDSVSKLVEAQNDCGRNVELKSQLKVLKLHIESLENQLSNTCHPPRKDDKLINSQSTTSNWIYGSLSPKDYHQQLDDLSKTYNLIECDKNLPFVINNQCATCSKEEQIFSFQEGKCIDQCPTGKVFLKSNHQCRDPSKKEFLPSTLSQVDISKNPYVWGPITQQQFNDRIEELKNNNIETETCSAEKPFPLNGQTCATCRQGQLFNVGTKSCTNCKQQQKYLPTTHECKQLYKKPNYTSGKNWIAQNGDNTPIDNKLKQLQAQGFPVEECPPEKPFPSKDLKSCLVCEKYYNLITGVCDECSRFFTIKNGDHQCTYVTEDCPKDNFWNGEKCIPCIDPGRYDNNFRQCICEEPLKYDEQIGECIRVDKNNKNSNPGRATNYIGTAPKATKLLDNCPDSTPFFDQTNQVCIQCSLPTKYFNYDTKKCEQCDKNLQFNITEKKCVQPIIIFNSNIGPDVNNYRGEVPNIDKSKDFCPKENPFFDGYHCVSCSKPQYFDFKDRQCKSCPIGKSFNTVTKVCIDSKLLQPKFVSNIPSDINNFFGKIPDEKPDTQGQEVKKCPLDKPFSNGKECISCVLPRYFNFQSGQCQMCKEGYSFSTSQRECQKNTFAGTDVYNSNMVNAENFIGKIPSYKAQYPQCPSDKRYFDSQICRSCELPQYWNFDKNECESCKKGLYFDKIASQCLYSPENQKYRTNLDATNNIYFYGDFEQVKQQIGNQGSKPLCGTERPFFDKSSNKCISCDGDANIFNYVKNHCMRCPQGTFFDEEDHICIQKGIDPTVERMVMNSVSWI